MGMLCLMSIGSRPKRIMLVFLNANREIRKLMDTVVTFTQEYSRVLYLSSGKQWLNILIVNHHVSTS